MRITDTTQISKHPKRSNEDRIRGWIISEHTATISTRTLRVTDAFSTIFHTLVGVEGWTGVETPWRLSDPHYPLKQRLRSVYGYLWWTEVGRKRHPVDIVYFRGQRSVLWRCGWLEVWWVRLIWTKVCLDTVLFGFGSFCGFWCAINIDWALWRLIR